MINELPLNVIEKFWKHLEKTDYCWNWTGTFGTHGAPTIRFWDPWKEYSARRVSLQISGKTLLNNDHVQPLICNNKNCVNPEHLKCGDEDRFWNSILKLSDASGSCWIWTKEVDKNMYGVFSLHDKGKIKRMRATHYSWLLFTGRQVPKGILLCHTCDTPSCVNPCHLFLGTTKDNMQDMMQKERGKSTLTTEMVLEIRELSKTMKTKDIAIKFGVTLSCIYGIVSRKRWKHLP